jgi:hypothetical protein
VYLHSSIVQNKVLVIILHKCDSKTFRASASLRKKCVSGKTSLGRNANLTEFEVFSGFAFRPQCPPKHIFSKDWSASFVLL